MHTCHARGCDVRVRPCFLMCLHHWSMVPRDIRRLLWATYTHRQEVTKSPSREYLRAARLAISAVHDKESAA